MSMDPKDFLFFINRALDGMLSKVEELGDARVNQRPDLPGANSPYVIMSHCVGLTNFFLGAAIAGRDVQRDRDAEFSAQGTVADIRQAVRALQEQIQHDITQAQGDQPPARTLTGRAARMQDWKQGEILLQCYTELAQHHGHMDLTRDLLLAG